MRIDVKQSPAILADLHREVRMRARANILREKVSKTAGGSLPASLVSHAKLRCSMKMMP
jgi:hypothetical protein